MFSSVFLAAYLLQATYIDLFNDGHRLLDQGNIKEAEVALKESASLNPGYAPALKGLGEAYVKLKRLPEAIEAYQRAIEINPKDIQARGRLAELYSWAGNHDKAIVTYRDVLELDPRNPVLKTGLATVLRWSHRYDEAERLFKEVLALEPENNEALKGLAKTYSMAGDLTSSVAVFEKAVSIYKEDYELHKELGTVLAWQKDFKKAIIELGRSIELSPNYAEAHRTKGDVYLWMKSYQQAIEAYKKATDIEPNNLENHLLLARVYKHTGDNHLAEESVKAALRIDPAAGGALELLRELRGGSGYLFINRVGDGVELTAFVFVFVLLFFTYRSRRRMLMRRHRIYFYFINFVLPALVFITFLSFLGRTSLTEWLDINLVEDIAEAILFFALGTSLMALLWTERRSHDFLNLRILAIGAHPDDIELGCGAFIMKAKDSGAKIYGLTMTKGEKGTEKAGKREDELKKAARFMELDGVWINDFPDTRLSDSVSGMKDVIEEKLKETGATLVLTHTPIDIHSDHQAVFEATKVAGRNVSVLCYEDVSTPREFVPNYFVDVAGYIEDKMKLVSFHKTQGEKNYMDPEVIKGRAAHRGIQGGVQYAEAFRVYKLLK
ncbi:MAG: tetratricopeptide repeat protein [Deltaproteobacteria bacterium]|nr:tetratricopeptide repeat protein [Deltaproteobacteria bacterium]